MTSWADTGVGARNWWGTHIVLIGLIFLGWAFALAQVLTMDTPGSLAGAGPGMQIFAHVKAHVFGDPFAFESALSFCATGTGVWGVADFVKSAAMWVGMILAMMFPALLPLGRNTSRVPHLQRVSTAGLAGYVVAWLPFCAAGVAAQWALQRHGLLGAHHVLQHDGLSITILLFVALFHLSGLATRSETRMQVAPSAQSYRTGLNYGAHCLRCCGPLMLVMFITGLMNLVAMFFLTLLMVVTMSGSNRVLSIFIAVSALAGATVLGAT